MESGPGAHFDHSPHGRALLEPAVCLVHGTQVVQAWCGTGVLHLAPLVSSLNVLSVLHMPDSAVGTEGAAESIHVACPF